MTGLSFDLTEEQEQLRQTVRDFAERECPKDVARRLEAAQEFPEDLARRIAKAGLNGIGIPEEYGGQGGDLLDQTIVCEELSRTLGGLAWLWGITVWSGARAVLHHAEEFDMQRYWRDARLYRIGPITNEMARNYIGESLGLPRSF